MAWSYDGQYLATCSRDKTIWIWEANEDNEFECAAVCSGHTQDVKFVRWHPARNQLFSASYDDTIKSWLYEPSVDDWLCSYTMTGHESTVWRTAFFLIISEIDFDQSGAFMVSCGEDKAWMVWQIHEQTFENKGMISGHHSRPIYSCALSKGTITSGESQQAVDLVATVRISE